MAFPLVGVVIATAALFLFIYWRNKQNRPKDGLKLPGPPGLPLIGNLLQVGRFPHVQFSKWAQEYGGIYSVRMTSQEIVIVSDPKLTKEIFSSDNAFTGTPFIKEFSMYPDEPGLGMFNSEGHPWEVHRRFLLRQLRDFGFGKSSLQALILDEVNEALDVFKKTQGTPNGRIRETLRLAVVNSLWSILTSSRFEQDDPQLLKLAMNTSEAFNSALEGGGILIFLPWIHHFLPNWSGYNAVQAVLKENKDFFDMTVRQRKANNKKNGDTHSDYLNVFLEEVRKTTDPNSPFFGDKAERFLVNELFDLFFAGSDTSATTIYWVIFYLCKNHEIQRKLQAEIAEVTSGNSRKVSVDDRVNMPYTQALIDEVLRHSSLVPDGVAHRVMADRKFHGYNIAKNSWIQPNLYWIHHDPKLWGDPETFRPERFLSADGKKYTKSENLQAFQVGKRQCVGEILARDSVFLFSTNIFQQFSVKFDPSSPEPTDDIMPGFFRVPLDFKVIMTDRLK